MHQLGENFINESEENKKLFINAMVFKNNKDFEILKKKFNDFLFKIRLYAYIKKTISFESHQIQKKENKKKERESLFLNATDTDFNEEKINSVPDDSIDFMREICDPYKEVDFNEIFYNKRILKSFKVLTNKQKEVIYECILKDKDEKIVAKELGVSAQAINKTKNTALEKLKKELRGEICGDI